MDSLSVSMTKRLLVVWKSIPKVA